MVIGIFCERKKDPYEIGMHLSYEIICENGFVYKRKKRSIYPIYNSDGTLLKCNQKIY
jgi:hypothetical protein